MKTVMHQQLEFFEIPSPCVGACSANENGFCHGCMRSREERFLWLTMSDAQKRDVLRLCQRRFLRRKKVYLQQESDIPKQASLF